ncbi:MAG: TlpA family protein disulfide reductase [Thermoguttaceae bacterium]|nr:TlpA family protein disulfide reductase [Thermoguttaceae bacterium]
MSKLTRIFFGGAAAFFLSVGFAAAQEDAAEELTDQLSDVAVLEENVEAEAAEMELPDLTIPENATPAELLAFVEGIEQKLPQPKTEDEFVELIRKISAVYKEVAEKVLADETATDEQRAQATELKVVAYTAAAQMGEEGAAEALDAMVSEMLASAKTDEEKIQAYQVKLQAITAGAQGDPNAIDKVAQLTDEVLSNKDSDELQVFGLELKAQEAFSRARGDEAKIGEFVEFLNGYIANADVSQRVREKAQELKLAALLIAAQSDASKDEEVDAYFDETLAGPLSPDTRQAFYQMRLQSLMAGDAMPGAAPKMSPEKLAKLDAVADKLLKEDSEDLKSMGYAVKATNLVQKAQDDPANIDAIFEFADKNLAGSPSETLKKQMTGLKIQGYMLKVQRDPAAAAEMLEFLDGELAGDANEETKTRLLTVKLQVLMMQVQTDPSYNEVLEKALEDAAQVEGLERLVQSGWGALYIGQIRNIAEKGGSTADFEAVIENIKAKMNESPILGFLVGNIKETIDTIGKNNNDPELTSRTFKDLIAAAEASENPMAKQVASNLQSMLDLAQIQGKPITIEGIEVGGENAKFSTADLAGKYFLIDVWSAKDQGYFETLEDLTALYKEFSPKGFEIVGINTDESAESIARAVDVLEMTWPVLSLPLSKDAGLDVLPEEFAALPAGTKVLVGPEGTVEIIDELDNVRSYLDEKLGGAEQDAEEGDEAGQDMTEETN